MKGDGGPIVTFECLAKWKEEDGALVTPLSLDEKALALAVARAYFYAHTLHEDLPERAGVLTYAGVAWGWGIHMVCERRAGRAWP